MNDEVQALKDNEIRDLDNRVDELEFELKDRMNRVDELTNRINALQNQVDRLKSKNVTTGEYVEPLPNTYDEWQGFGRLWLEGKTPLQWFDTSPDADHKWFDFEKDDCWYPYDEGLVIRIKPEGVYDGWV